MKLICEELRVEDLVDTGKSGDPQDPALTVKIGKLTKSTDRKVDAGTQATFPEKFEFDISKDEYNKIPMEVEVFNLGMSSFLKKIHVGSASVQLTTLIPTLNEPTLVSINLLHNKKTQKGKVLMKCTIVDPDSQKPATESKPTSKTLPPASNSNKNENPPAKKTEEVSTNKPSSEAQAESKSALKEPDQSKKQDIPSDKPQASEKKDSMKKQPEIINEAPAAEIKPLTFSDKTAKLKLTFSSFEAKDLMDTGSTENPQDPALEVSIGKKTFKTERQKDSGINAKFPESFEFIIPVDDYENGVELTVTAINRHMAMSAFDKQIGQTSKKLKEIFGELDKPIPIVLNLVVNKKFPKGIITCNGVASVVSNNSNAVTDEKSKKSSQTPSSESQSQKKSDKDVTAAPEQKKGDGEGKRSGVSGDPNKQLKLILTGIEASDLVNVVKGGDVQDPSVILSIGKTSYPTKRSVNAGTEAKFTECFEFTFSEADYENNLTIRCEVVHKSFMGSKTKIGEGGLSLKTLFPTFMKPTEGKFELSYEKNNQTITKGVVSVIGILSYVDAQLNASLIPKDVLKLPKEAQTATLAFTMTKLQAHALPDHSFLTDGQDPMVIMSIGGQKQETERQKDAKSNALFPETFLFQVDAKEIHSNGILIETEVLNKDIMQKRSLIAKGAIALKDVIASLNKPTFVKIDLVDKNGGPAGFVLFQGSLSTSATAKPEPNKLPEKGAEKKFPEESKALDKGENKNENNSKAKMDGKSFTTGEFRVLNIYCRDLINVELMNSSKNDPFVTLSFAGKEHITDAIEEGGANVDYEDLNYTWEVTRDQLDYEELRVVVTDRNTLLTSNKVIGTTSCSLSVLYDHINEKKVEIPLTIYTTKHKEAGKVILEVQLLSKEELQQRVVPPEKIAQFLSSLEKGMIKIHRARLIDLAETKNEIFAFQLRFEKEWKYDSSKIDLSKVELPIFDNLGISLPINRQYFESDATFTVDVFHQQMFVMQMLGKGSIPIKTLLSSIEAIEGKDCTLSIDLTTPKGAKVGKFVLSLQIVSEQVLQKQNRIELPNTFTIGKLHIQEIECNGLKNVEIVGKQDPYVIIHRPSTQWKDKTSVQNNVGNDAKWENLDMIIPDFTKEQLESDEKLFLEVFDDNDALPDAFVGSAEISLKEAAQQLKIAVPITVVIVDKKQKNAGRVTLTVTLSPVEKKEAPKNVPVVYLEIVRVIGDNLSSGNLFASPAPQISLQYKLTAPPSKSTGANSSDPLDPFSFVTPAQVDDRTNPVWDQLFATSKDFASSQCATEPLVVTYLDNNKPVAAATIENLYEAFLNLGEETLFAVDFLHPTAKNKKLGRARIIARMIPATERKAVIDATVKKVIDRPVEFEYGELFIKKIIIHNLKNTEWFGKADPFILVKFQEWIGQTEPLDNAGSEVIFNDLDLHVDVIAQDFLENQKLLQAGDGSTPPNPSLIHVNDLELSVYDKNDYRNNVLIGQAYFPIARYVYNVNQELTIEQELRDLKTNKVTGAITIVGELKKIDPTSLKQLPSTFQKGLLEITKISTFELKNRELTGKQDPFVIVHLNDQLIDQTPVINEGGSDCIFDDLEVRCLVTKEILAKGHYAFEVYDKDRMGKKFIGRGKVNLHSIRELEKEYQLSVRLIDDQANYCGRLLIFVHLLDGSMIDEQTLMERVEDKVTKPLPKEFQKGIFTIEKIITSRLKDIGGTFLTSQNPFVEVELLNWKDRTQSYQDVQQKENTKFSGGKDCRWDVLDLQTIVDKSIIEREELVVTVRHTSMMSKNHEIIGQGRIKIVKTANHYQETVKLELPIYDPKKSDVKTGKVTLFARLDLLDSDELNDDQIEIPANFESGIFKISTIEVFHLKNTEIWGKQDPFVMINYGTFLKERTYTQENAGEQAKWEHLPYECEIYREQVESNRLEIMVMDENTARPNALIGQASISLKRNLKRLNQEIPLTLTLLDKQQKVTGKCKIYATVSIPEPEAELPENMSAANVRIKRIAMFDVKNTEFFGLSKIDPFVIVNYGNQTFTTKTMKNAGGNVEWSALDYDVLCDTKQLRVGKVECEVYTSKRLLGKGSFFVKDFYEVEGKDKERTCQLITEKGQVAGRMTVLGQIAMEKQYVAPTLDLPPDFQVGNILISYLEGSKLKNTEIAGKQDPYCRLSIGDWTETTSTLDNAGANPVWPELEMLAEVNRDMLANDELVIQFFDQNFSQKDKPLGKGSISLRSLCSRINQPTDLAFDIIDEKGAIISHAKVTAKLIKGDAKEATEGLPESVVKVDKGILEITDIYGFDLRGSDFAFLGDKQDPYCVVEIGDWSHRTNTVKNVSRSFAWNQLADCQVLVTKDMLKHQRLTVSVMDSGLTLSGASLGRGDMSLRKVGMDFEKIDTYKIRLKDARGRNAGRIELKAVIHPVPAEPLPTNEANEKGQSNTHTTPGKLQIVKLHYSELKQGSSLLGKNNIYAKAFIAPNWSQLLPVLSSAGNENEWKNLKVETNKMARNHLEKQGLKIEFFTKASTAISSDSSIGIAHFPLGIALQKPNEWVTIPAQIQQQGQFAGKCHLQTRFVSDEELMTIPLENEEIKQSNAELLHKVSTLEKSLRSQLHKEMEAERKTLLQTMKVQNDELKTMLEAALKKMHQQQKAKDAKEAQPPKADEQLPEITGVDLPKNIARWRTAHVQAWLAFELGLPQYLEAFTEASVDGLLLLKHLDHKLIKDYLKVDDEIHRTKIVLGIQQLKERQAKYLAFLEQRRQEKELERQRRLQREEEERKRREVKEKQKKKAGKRLPPPTMSKPDFIDNGVNRVKLETALKTQNQLLREKQQKLAAQYQRYNKTWQFEYSGRPKPEEMTKPNNLWSSLDRYHSNKRPEVGTKHYQQLMKDNILKEVTPVQREIREIPKNCTTDEVLAIVKGAMFEVSNWLLKLEEMNFKKNFLLDEDLDEFLEEISLPMFSGDEGMGPSPALQQEEEEKEELPPSYSHCLEETKSTGNVVVIPSTTSPRVDATEDNADDDDEPPPDYDEVLQSKEFVTEEKIPTRTDKKDQELEEINLSSPVKEQSSTASLLPAPTIEIPLSTQQQQQQQHLKSRKRKQLTELLLQSQQYGTFLDPHQVPPYETNRMKLIYQAMIDQTNNNARWLGSNQKLTRLKLEGGIENLLKLRLSWEQFDMLWTRLDVRRSGDIDFEEFERFFGNLKEFLTQEGMNHLTLTRAMTSNPSDRTQYYNQQGNTTTGTTSQSPEMKALIEYLYQFCDTLRKTNFTILEIFQSFDRNGSGEVSISEFCSLLRLILGPQIENDSKFDKKMIYRSLNILDVDGNKSISLQEMLFFIYRIWKTQLQDLAQEIARINNDQYKATTGMKEDPTMIAPLTGTTRKQNQQRQQLIQSLLQEREDLKTAIKRNFPRHWRDKLERLGMETNTIPGPFTHLLNQMHILAEESAEVNFTSTKNYKTTFTADLTRTDDNDHFFGTQTMSKGLPIPPQSMESPARPGSAPPKGTYISTSSPTKKPGRTYLSGHNALLRFKIRMPAGAPPVRTATHHHQPMKLAVPPTNSLNAGSNMMTGETTQKVLTEFDYMSGMMH